MTKITLSRILLFLGLSLPIPAYSDTIDYTTFRSTACNVFASPTSVGGFTHQTVASQPQYNSIDQSIMLACRDAFAGLSKGTEYQIQYPFKKGASYKITVHAAAILPATGGFPLLRLRIDNGGNGANNTCGYSSFNSFPTDLNYSLGINNFFTDYIFTFHSLSDAASFLLIAAVPSSNDEAVIEISKIVIEETIPPPKPEFQLSPSSVSMTCGYEKPQTFVVNNPSGIPGILSYTWNLGSTPNGWLDGGSAAPATKTTTTNTISLTPACQTQPKDISVTVNVNGSAYNTYPSKINYSTSLPPVVISGDDEICKASSATYSLSNLACNALVSWSVAPAGWVSLTPSGTGITITNPLDSEGITLKASMSSCGQDTVVSKVIDLGAISNGKIAVDLGRGVNPNDIQCATIYTAHVKDTQPHGRILDYDWSFPSDEWSIVGEANRSSVNFAARSGEPLGYLEVKLRNKCGWNSGQGIFMSQVDSCTFLTH